MKRSETIFISIFAAVLLSLASELRAECPVRQWECIMMDGDCFYPNEDRWPGDIIFYYPDYESRILFASHLFSNFIKAKFHTDNLTRGYPIPKLCYSRAFQANFTIANDSLFLTEICLMENYTGPRGHLIVEAGEVVPLTEFFPNHSTGRVFADWVSGTYRYESSKGVEHIFVFEKGKLTLMGTKPCPECEGDSLYAAKDSFDLPPCYDVRPIGGEGLSKYVQCTKPLMEKEISLAKEDSIYKQKVKSGEIQPPPIENAPDLSKYIERLNKRLDEKWDAYSENQKNGWMDHPCAIE